MQSGGALVGPGVKDVKTTRRTPAMIMQLGSSGHRMERQGVGGGTLGQDGHPSEDRRGPGRVVARDGEDRSVFRTPPIGCRGRRDGQVAGAEVGR